MKEFYIITAITFLEIALVTWLSIQINSQTKKVKFFTKEVEKTFKVKLSELRNSRQKLKDFNKSIENKLKVSKKRSELIEKIIKELLLEFTTEKILHIKHKFPFMALKKLANHKIELIWFFVSTLFLKKKTT